MRSCCQTLLAFWQRSQRHGAAQGYRGWRYGYVDASTRMDNTSVFYEFVWNPSPDNNQLADGKWTPGVVRAPPSAPP